jgi:glycosyltransferase involved in cell wall biosynthesis
MNVTQITIGRFHHFHLARQLEKKGLLNCLWTGYPRFKLQDEQNIPKEKIKVFPWLQTMYMARARVGMAGWSWLDKELWWQACNTLDQYVARQIKEPTVLIALSGSGLHAGKSVQQTGGKYICDRGSAHIRFQQDILKEEYNRWGLNYAGIDPRIISKEEAEYEQADEITVPSEFVKNSFIKMGVSVSKLNKVVYGARLERFHKIAQPSKSTFTVLYVGSVSIRKAFLDLLAAFTLLKHPKKELLVIGAVAPEIQPLFLKYNLSQVRFLGQVPNEQLPEYYSKAHVFVLPSIEEGLAMVQGEALACGCPVIATTNTGSEDLFTDKKEGFIVPIRSPKIIAERMQELADNEDLRMEMSEAAVLKIRSLAGWDTYGNNYEKFLRTL